MIGAFIDTLEIIPRGLAFVGLGLIVLVIAKLARDLITCLLYTSPSPRDLSTSRMPSSA